jgi:poly(3-hydroxybutyrate) depolymerase
MVMAALCAACGSSQQEAASNGGSANNAAAGTSTDGGASGQSTTATGGGGGGGNGNGASGATSAAGTTNTAGQSTGGTSAQAGSGGVASAGSPGQGGSAGTTPMEPATSAGCGMMDPVTGDRQITIENNEAHFLVSIPDDYDANHPYPLGFGFHGRNRTGPNCHDGDCAGFQEVMHNEAILVYMTSLGGTGWEGDTERELNVTFFDTVLTQMKTEYCVDESRVFVAGTSSGASFTNVLGCRFADQLLAVAPVAGAMPETENCAGPVAALVIHGVDDYHVPFDLGVEARDYYVAQNGCMATTDISISTLHDEVVATRESHQCATYQGCPDGLVVTWCEHSEGGYDGSTHGWPLFGGQAIWDFVSALP